MIQKRYYLIFIALLISIQSYSQVIRKNWREMTTHERTVYINALRALYLKSPNVVETYVATHSNSQYVKHFNQDFLPWHRMFIYYFEQELKNSGVANAANIALPYWAWDQSGDWSSTSPMFSNGSGGNNGLFGFALPNGTYTRGFGQSFAQPTSSALTSMINNSPTFGSDFGQSNNFWPRLEGTHHGNGHVFIGGNTGTMSDIQSSPRDPIFYQHHNYVDKIWQDWHNVHGSSTVPNPSVLINTVPGKPQIARSGTLDSRSLKVWFATAGQVILDRYTVTNTENYRYTGTFSIGNATTAAHNFVVASGTTCNIISGTQINLKPGFIAVSGSAFSAKVDPVSNPGSIFNTGREDNGEEPVATVNEEGAFTADKLNVFPNPSVGGIFTVALLTNEEVEYDYAIYDGMGTRVLNESTPSTAKQFDVNLSEKPRGMYLLHLQFANGKTYIKKMVSH